jgi:hypothetical protein
MSIASALSSFDMEPDTSGDTLRITARELVSLSQLFSPTLEMGTLSQYQQAVGLLLEQEDVVRQAQSVNIPSFQTARDLLPDFIAALQETLSETG